MAGYKALAILLAVAALLAAAARALDGDDHMYCWKCFKSCMQKCYGYGDGAAAAKDGPSGGLDSSAVSVIVPAPGKCKNGCLEECFEDLPALCYHQCAVTTCLCLPPFSKERAMCFKSCCDKCFHHGPPAPGPGPMPPSQTNP